MITVKELIKKVSLKLASKPFLGTYYILNSNVFYSVTKEGGLDHPPLWKKIVLKFLPYLVYENKMELIKASYATDRGRVTWVGELDSEGMPMGKGHYLLLGTKGSKPYEAKLKKIFNLDSKVKTEFADDHYKIAPSDAEVLKDNLKLYNKDKLNLQDTEIV